MFVGIAIGASDTGGVTRPGDAPIDESFEWFAEDGCEPLGADSELDLDRGRDLDRKLFARDLGCPAPNGDGDGGISTELDTARQPSPNPWQLTQRIRLGSRQAHHL